VKGAEKKGIPVKNGAGEIHEKKENQNKIYRAEGTPNPSPETRD